MEQFGVSNPSQRGRRSSPCAAKGGGDRGQEVKLPHAEFFDDSEVSRGTRELACSAGRTVRFEIVSESGIRELTLRTTTPPGVDNPEETSGITRFTVTSASREARRFPSPVQITTHLDTRVHGQEQAKKALATAVYQHYHKQHESGENPASSPKARPKHVLLVGPTGTGKTELVKTLAEYLDVPVLFYNSAAITAEGYVGNSVTDLLERYAAICNHDPARMERGIIFLDEFDKLRSNDVSGDVRGKMVQQELLALLDGSVVNRAAKSQNTPSLVVDTSKILFIVAGAFAEITNPEVDRGDRGYLGFLRSAHDPGDNSREQITAQDIEEYGFIREIVSRFPSIGELNPLTCPDLIAIMTDPLKSPLTEVIMFFKAHGISLEITPDGLTAIAQQVLEAGLGARGLHQIFSRRLGDLIWQVTDLHEMGVKRLLIDENVIVKGAAARAEFRSASEPAPDLPDLSPEASPQLTAPDIKELQWQMHISNRLLGMSEDQIFARLSYLKDILRADLRFDWWAYCERTLQPIVLLRFAEELLVRNIWLPDFVDFQQHYDLGETLTIEAIIERYESFRASGKRK